MWGQLNTLTAALREQAGTALQDVGLDQHLVRGGFSLYTFDVQLPDRCLMLCLLLQNQARTQVNAQFNSLLTFDGTEGEVRLLQPAHCHPDPRPAAP